MNRFEKTDLLNSFSLFMLMLITGVFWGTWFTLTRSIETFSPGEFIHIGQVIIANVAVPMRIIIPLGIVSILISLWFYPDKKHTGFYLGVISFILIIAVLLITLLVLVPIDNDIKTWTPAGIPPDFESLRNEWKKFHAYRTFLSILSFGCFTLSSAMGKKQAVNQQP